MAVNDLFPEGAPQRRVGPPTEEEFYAQTEGFLGEPSGDALAPKGINDFLREADIRRGTPQDGREQFGRPVAPQWALEHPSLLYPPSSQQPVDIEMMPGKYFAALPIIKGGTAEFPVGIWASRNAGESPTETNMRNILKDIQEKEAYPAVAEIAHNLFQEDVLGGYMRLQDKYGVQGWNRILGGKYKTKQETNDFFEFQSAITAAENTANFTQRIGKLAEKLSDRKNSYLSGDTQEFVASFLGGLKKEKFADRKEFMDYLNRGMSIMTKEDDFDTAVKRRIDGNAPTVMALVDATKAAGQTAFSDVEALINSKQVPISGAQAIVRKRTGELLRGNPQLDFLATSLYDDGYTFDYVPEVKGAKTEEEKRAKAINHIKDRIVNRFIETTEIPFVHYPFVQQQRQTQPGISKNYLAIMSPNEVFSVKDPVTGAFVELEAPRTWKLSTEETPTVTSEAQFQYDSRSSAFKKVIGPVNFTFQEIRELPVEKKTGTPIPKELMGTASKYAPENIEYRLFVVGISGIRRKATTTEINSGLADRDGYIMDKSTPALTPFKTFENILKQKEIVLEGYGGSGAPAKSAQTPGAAPVRPSGAAAPKKKKPY